MAGRKGGERKKMMTRSMMDDLQFLVGCIGCYLKKGRYAQRIAFGAHVFFPAILEYLITEMVELEGIEAKENKIHIVPHHLLLATRNYEELTKLLDGITIAHGGVLPNIHFVLFSKKANLH